jgi:hypothetical protein
MGRIITILDSEHKTVQFGTSKKVKEKEGEHEGEETRK